MLRARIDCAQTAILSTDSSGSLISVRSKFVFSVKTTKHPNQRHFARVPPQHEGRMRIVTKRAAGCDGRGSYRSTSDARRGRRRRVGLAPYQWQALSLCLNEAQATVTQKPVSPGRARYSLLTPSRRECRCFGFTCSDYARVLFAFAYGAMGAAEHLAFPAPSGISDGGSQASSGAMAR
jgi:hypothetical protein